MSKRNSSLQQHSPRTTARLVSNFVNIFRRRSRSHKTGSTENTSATQLGVTDDVERSNFSSIDTTSQLCGSAHKFRSLDCPASADTRGGSRCRTLDGNTEFLVALPSQGCSSETATEKLRRNSEMQQYSLRTPKTWHLHKKYLVKQNTVDCDKFEDIDKCL